MEAKDHPQREKSPLLSEVDNVEKKFLGMMTNSKTLWHSDVQVLYKKVCSCYEEVVLGDHKLEELQDVEYSMWKLHYRVIDEFRKRLRRDSNNGGTSNECVEGFKSFLSEGSGFYQNLIVRLRKCYGHGQDLTLGGRNGVIGPNRIQKKFQFLWHRFLVCLGDLARYNEQCEKSGQQKWSVPASHYLEATEVWPYNGNPQNQLAVLATYIGDEFLALYHCIRSLAVNEPFPDAWNNLLLLCEKNRSSSLPFISSDACFNFLEPGFSVWMNEQQEESNEKSLWLLVIRVVSFFFLDSSFEEFPCTFASCIKELELLLSKDDTKLKSAMESYQHMDSAKRGPFRTLQLVCILIFAIEHLINSKEVNNLSPQWALTAIFIVMGRLVDRCSKANPSSSCILLPSVLVFVQWLLTVFDKVETLVSDDRTTRAKSYFFGSLSELSKRLEAENINVEEGSVTLPLWEDYELRGFAPLALSHEGLDFSTHQSQEDSFGNRVRRLINAAKSEKFTKKSIDHQGSGKSASLEEEEVILFKPLTRHNSAPAYSSFDHPMEAGYQSVPADECLRRATSLLIAQNQAHQGEGTGCAFHSGLTNFRKQQPLEQPLNGAVMSLFSEPTISAGPPSLRSWVFPSHEKTKKHTLPPIDEAVTELSISGYSPPLPSAPFLPDDAPWANDNGNLPMPRFLDRQPRPAAGFSNCNGRMSSSEWLRQYREGQIRQEVRASNSHLWQPSHTCPYTDQQWGTPQWPGLPPVRDYFGNKEGYYWDGGLNGREPEPLLQYLKEKEWRLLHQQDSSLRGPGFIGS